MSTYFLVRNATKREYFNIEVFGDSSRDANSCVYVSAHIRRPYLYPYALVQLCVTCDEAEDVRGRWQGDRFEFVSDNSGEWELIFTTYRDISLILLDGLCEDDEDFIREILRRGLSDDSVFRPVTTALLTLLGDAQYNHFRHYGKRFHNEYSAYEEIPEGAEDRWGLIVASLREHYQQYYRCSNMAPPDYLASGTPM